MVGQMNFGLSLQGRDSMHAFWLTFHTWQHELGESLLEHGYWCDAVDPQTGYPIRSSRSERWNEVQIGHQLLGYPLANKDGTCPLLLHPIYGKTISWTSEDNSRHASTKQQIRSRGFIKNQEVRCFYYICVL